MRPTDPLTDDSLLTLQDLARHLNVSKRTIQQMVADGDCPRPFKLGGAVRWRWATIREWVRAVELLESIKRSSVQKDAEPRESTRKPARGRDGSGSEPK